MNENIRQLLILQDRDMKFTRLEDELESLDPERESAKRDSLKRQEVYDNAKQHLVQLEVTYQAFTSPVLPAGSK